MVVGGRPFFFAWQIYYKNSIYVKLLYKKYNLNICMTKNYFVYCDRNNKLKLENKDNLRLYNYLAILLS